MAKVLFCLLLLLLLSLDNVQARIETCIASIYAVGDSSQPGTRTASGIPLNNNALTAAHKTLPFGRKVRVTNLRNNQHVIVRITDRGPYVRGRCIDLTKASARAIGCPGLCKVRLDD